MVILYKIYKALEFIAVVPLFIAGGTMGIWLPYLLPINNDMIEVMQCILFVPGMCFGWVVTCAPLCLLSDKIDRIRYERMLKRDEEDRLRGMAKYHG